MISAVMMLLSWLVIVVLLSELIELGILFWTLRKIIRAVLSFGKFYPWQENTFGPFRYHSGVDRQSITDALRKHYFGLVAGVVVMLFFASGTFLPGSDDSSSQLISLVFFLMLLFATIVYYLKANDVRKQLLRLLSKQLREANYFQKPVSSNWMPELRFNWRHFLLSGAFICIGGIILLNLPDWWARENNHFKELLLAWFLLWLSWTVGKFIDSEKESSGTVRPVLLPLFIVFVIVFWRPAAFYTLFALPQPLWKHAIVIGILGGAAIFAASRLLRWIVRREPVLINKHFWKEILGSVLGASLCTFGILILSAPSWETPYVYRQLSAYCGMFFILFLLTDVQYRISSIVTSVLVGVMGGFLGVYWFQLFIGKGTVDLWMWETVAGWLEVSFCGASFYCQDELIFDAYLMAGAAFGGCVTFAWYVAHGIQSLPDNVWRTRNPGRNAIFQSMVIGLIANLALFAFVEIISGFQWDGDFLSVALLGALVGLGLGIKTCIVTNESQTKRWAINHESK
jgi:hypothetical protein